MRLAWSVLALSDRANIFDRIEQDSPKAAVAIDLQIEMAADRLLQFPHSGRPGRVMGTRELVITGTSYIAAYRVTTDTVRILRVLHGAQIWPDDFSKT